MIQSTDGDPRRFLHELFEAGVRSVHPDSVMDGEIPERPRGRTIVIGAGKAAAAMAAAFERRWEGPVEGIVVTRYGHGASTTHVEVVEAAHPVPDEGGIDAARRIMALARSAGRDDLVIVLVSGGASALLTAPAPGVSLAQKQEINRALLRSGAPITEMNTVRRHLSSVKGGRLARLIEPARSLTLVISDVAGDDPAVVGSGPTVADATRVEEAFEILDRYRIDVPEAVRRAMATHREGVRIDPALHEVRVVAGARSMLSAAAALAEHRGVRPIVLADDFEIDAVGLARVHASIARQVRSGHGVARPPCVLLSGGETSVAVQGQGRGGRNGQFLLALALALDGMAHTWAIACDSDGIDGSEDNAGGVITPDSLERLARKGADARELLRNNDAYHFFEQLDDLVVTGPTRTNVNDFRAVLMTD